MYCPQCSQQQLSDEMRFCSRCGFPLEGVGLLLASDGVLPTLAAEGGEGKLSPRRRGARQGAALIFIGVVLLPLLGMILEEPGALMAVTIIFAGVMRLIYAFIFQEGAAQNRRAASLPHLATDRAMLGVAGARPGTMLPPKSVDGGDFSSLPRRVKTAEIQPPPSVTENTTRLLDE